MSEQKTFKLCSKCGETKPHEEFSKHYQCRGGREGTCQDCKNKRVTQWYQDNPTRYWAHLAVGNARRRAREYGVPFDLTDSYIHDMVLATDVCPVFGIHIRWPKLKVGGKVGPQGRSPTLDRVDPRLGYVPGNVRIISFQANRAKWDHTPEEILAWTPEPYDESRRAIQHYIRQHYAEKQHDNPDR